MNLAPELWRKIGFTEAEWGLTELFFEDSVSFWETHSKIQQP